jgi:hypothetical protein
MNNLAVGNFNSRIVITTIISYIGKIGDLNKCARVNKQWYWIAMDYIRKYMHVQNDNGYYANAHACMVSLSVLELQQPISNGEYTWNNYKNYVSQVPKEYRPWVTWDALLSAVNDNYILFCNLLKIADISFWQARETTNPGVYFNVWSTIIRRCITEWDHNWWDRLVECELFWKPAPYPTVRKAHVPINDTDKRIEQLRHYITDEKEKGKFLFVKNIMVVRHVRESLKCIRLYY